MKVLSDIAQSNAWWLIWPEITLGVLALGLLVATMVRPQWTASRFFALAFGGQLLVVGGFIFLWYSASAPSPEAIEVGSKTMGFGDLLVQSSREQWMRCFFLLSVLPVSWLSAVYLKKQLLPAAEFYAIACVVTAALMLLVQSQHFVLFFVALETAAVGFYVLVSYCRKSALSLEAGLKYLILGALSSALLLMGIVLLYGAGSRPDVSPDSIGRLDALHFDQLSTVISANPQNLWVHVGAVLVLAGLAFKIGVFPFQIWIPDVYQGAPTPTAAFLAVSSKAAGIFALISLIRGPFHSLGFLLEPMLSTAAVLTILFGNLAALTQYNVKRLMGLSGIAHAGYLLMGAVAAFKVSWIEVAVGFYLLTYFLGAFAVFGVMAHVAGTEDANQKLEDYRGLGRKQPFLAIVLTLGLGSLAGIPPLAGFAGKLLLFLAAFEAGLYALMVCTLIGVFMGVYYYLAWVREAVFAPREPQTSAVPTSCREDLNPSRGQRWAWGSLAAGTIVIGLYQGGLLRVLSS